MKRNGFTLVEMMAVIVLVGLLAVIGVATYTNVNESAKEKTLESKKEQIRAAGIKWAKENNINYKTIISVNALVVEGYLSAEENEVGKIGVIENPVTGENMICNTVDISIKEGEYIATVNDKEQNCTLATQSLVDTNINIKVVDEKNKDVTGSGSIAKWSNQNVMIIVSSSSYDSRATSISYDFEGNTVTKQKSGKQKYTGNAYVKEGEAGNYYNVFHVNAALMLNTKIVVTYNIAGESSKSRAYTIRIDKEEATATVSSNSEWLTVDKDVYITVDDGKGSGPKHFYIGKDQNINNATRKDASYKTKVSGLDVGKYYIWTEDIAGNISSTYKITLELNNVDKTDPSCEVVFHGTPGNAGWYKEVPVTPGGRNTVKAGISGMNLGVNTTPNDPEYTAFAQYNTIAEGLGATRTTETTRDGVNYYCYVKTLAGKTASNSRNLKLDMTPPTFTIDTTSNTTYAKNQKVNFTIKDTLSGMPSGTHFRYTWALNSPDGPRKAWFTYSFSFHGYKTTITQAMSGDTSMTGKYYLVIDYSEIEDVAGNRLTDVNGTGGGGTATFGPFYFDNTPPVCDGNNGKTNWTTGGYTINQYCIDNDGTDDQSGCVKRTYTTKYLDTQTVKNDKVTIADNAGNEAVCDYNVYIDNTAPYCGNNDGKSYWTTGEVKVTLACVEDENTQSGCESKAYTSTWNGSVDYETGTMSVKDRVGNKRDCTVDVYLDNIPPTCSLSFGSQVGFNYSDNHVKEYGLSTSSYSANGSTTSGFAHNTTYYGIVKDQAGNQCTTSAKVRKTIDRYIKKSKYCNRAVASWQQTAKKCNYNGKTQKWKTCERKDDGEGGYDYYWSYTTKYNQSRCFTYTAFDCTSNYYQDGTNYECYDAYGLGSGTTTTESTCSSSGWSCGSSYVNQIHYDCSPNYTYSFDAEVTTDVTDCKKATVSKCNSSNYSKSNVTCDKYIGCESGYTKINDSYCHS